MSREDQVLDKLRLIIDPDLGQDIVTLGFVQNLKITEDGDVGFDLELTTPACPVKEQFRVDCREAISSLTWVKNVDLNLTSSAPRKSALSKAGPGLSGVRYILAVASCKGGVGKSTVAVNLACSLAGKGASTGIFDADVYGPSLPTLIRVDYDGLYQRDNLILPLDYNSIKLMSFAYATQHSGGGPAIMRGPMVTQVVNQLLTGTDWGALDYLVIDMPPGTGDVQLTLSQIIPMTAAVIVTTPQTLSFVDVVKGIQMFDKMNVPTIAVIENMSYFQCPECGSRHEVFGAGSRRKLVDQFGIKDSFTLPIDAKLSSSGDLGIPLVVGHPDDDIAREFSEIADAVVRETSRVAHGTGSVPEVSFVAERGVKFVNNGAERWIPAPTLRRRCRCAQCCNEMTGERRIADADIDDDVTPTSISRVGNYAVGIEWSDGHSSIFPFQGLTELATDTC